jgi:hypothetical protein
MRYFRLAASGGPPSRYFVAMWAPSLGRMAIRRVRMRLTTVKAWGVRAVTEIV